MQGNRQPGTPGGLEQLYFLLLVVDTQTARRHTDTSQCGNIPVVIPYNVLPLRETGWSVPGISVLSLTIAHESTMISKQSL